MEERKVDEARQTLVRKARRGIVAHAIPYVLTIALFAVANVLSGGPPWSLMVALLWGIGLALHAWSALSPDEDKLTAKARAMVDRTRSGHEALERAMSAGKRMSDTLRSVQEAVNTTGVRVDPQSAVVPETHENESDSMRDDAQKQRCS
jgi:hypothetical protein